MVKNVVFCITTYNRVTYLQDCINTFLATKSDNLNWHIIVADDGSTDGTLEYLENLDIEIPLIIIKNKRAFISRQSNSLFEVCKYINYDFGFKVDDDVYFVQKGWDLDYINAYKTYNFGHLVHYNPEHLPYRKQVLYGNLIAPTDAIHCMGCLYTFIPKIFDDVGYFDEIKFSTFGHGHQEWTLRCCRAGYNDPNNVYDVKNSHIKVKLKCPQTEKDYITYKGNVNTPNWNKLLEVWNDSSIIYKSHTESPKILVLINCIDIDDKIKLLNETKFVQKATKINDVILISDNDELTNIFCNILKIIGYDNIYINSDIECDESINITNINMNNMSQLEKIHKILLLINHLRLGNNLSSKKLDLINKSIA